MYLFSIFFLLQYYKPEGIPDRKCEHDVCALCGNQFLVKVGQEGVIENTYKLTCSHEYVNISIFNALSFYRSKIILDRPNHFGRVWIVLDLSNSF